jgi:hypothetical protein
MARIEIKAVVRDDDGDITHVLWYHFASRRYSVTPESEVILWLKAGNRAFTRVQGSVADVRWVDPKNGVPYLRSVANGKTRDNLDHLPSFVYDAALPNDPPMKVRISVLARALEEVAGLKRPK